MKPSAIREMGIEDLRHKETELREQLFRLRLQRSLGRLESAMKLRQTRRDIARVLSILREKQVSR
jgi:large subunit ribosomal protein L29